MESEGVLLMYQDMYERWLAAELDDADLKPELESVKGDDAAIQDRFAVALKFGTAGLRGVIGAGTNRMNIYVVRQATQGLANWVKTQGGSQTVAISYDSRIKSNLFARTAAEVLAANGIKVRIYSALMPVPALSFATRYYNCNAGIMVTASHNPAKYNGYKAYGPDGCQMTDEAADIVYAEIQKTDILTGAKLISFEDGMAQGLIEYVGDDCINALYAAIEARSIRPGICKTAGLKLVYSPLNGSGLVPVTHVLGDIGITDITIVPEQKDPDGNFPTCPYPNPEIFEALRLGLELAEKSDVIISMVPKSEHSMSVYKTILPVLGAGKTCIDMSTIDPSVSVEISKMVKATGAAFMDAPVVKSKPAAIAGKLGIYMGGDEATCEAMRPILAYMGENIIRMGDNGKGLVMKICHNALVTQIQNGVNETLSLAQLNGISVEDYATAISYGGGQNFYLDGQWQKLRDEDYTTAFSLANAAKDVGICMNLAKECGLDMPGEANVKKVYDKGMEAGMGGDDWRSTFKLVRGH